MIYPWTVFSDGEKLVSGQKITSIKNRILSNDVYIELLNVPELVYVTFEFLKRTQLQVGWFYFRDESGQDFAIPESEFLAKFKPVAGGNGDKGDPGKDGVGIKTITASQEGGVVTLTIEMTDGTQQTPSFTLPSA
ncbi:TPA: hypothetical protein SMP68_002553 [Proteus mirabilis]|nr:hypothetical protein [Proteus mirabilis]